MSKTNPDEEAPTTVSFTDGTTVDYNVIIRRYDSNWLYALRPDTPANHCVLNTDNITRIEAQTVTQINGGVGYCDFEWREKVETMADQDGWIALEDDRTER